MANERTVDRVFPSGYRDARDADTATASARASTHERDTEILATVAPADTGDATDTMARIENAPTSTTESADVTEAQPVEDAVGHAVRFARGAAIGRYLLLSEIGRGAMGAVYAAYDPELDRRVALKILRTGRSASERSRQRLVREARALAQLSHPHVVQVHDVGVHGSDVFLAMEFVEGESLRDFCKHTPRPSWREILAAYLEAARGLAAAHEKGLIHRDVKPANILRANDGRVRVADFGLAAAQRSDLSGHSADQSSSADASPSKSDMSAASLRGHLAERLTATGAIMGTPGFMAPEQHTGGHIGPEADQYSLCASLYESLYDQLPFHGKGSLPALLRQKLSDQVLPPPANTDVPAWLHQVLLRGMRSVPGERYPSMHALIAALEEDPAVRRRSRMRTAAISALIAGLAGLAVFGWTQAPGAAMPCEDLDRELAGIWDAEVQDGVRAAFAALDQAYAAEAFERFSAALNTYAGAWLAMRQETCEATHVYGRQPAATMGLRITCLDERRRRMGALASVLTTSMDAEVLRNAGQAALALPPIDDCADLMALTAMVPPPEDPALRAKVDALSVRLSAIAAMGDAGKYKQALADGQAFLKEIGTIEYVPLRARAQYEVAVLLGKIGDYQASEIGFRRVLPLAGRAKDDVLIAKAWSRLFAVVANDLARHDDAMSILPFAETAVFRADNRELSGVFSSKIGLFYQGRGLYADALPYHEEAVATLTEALGPNHLETATALSDLARNLSALGRYEEALAAHERARAIREAVLGKEHPLLGESHASIGDVYQSLGRVSDALASQERALAILETTLGPEHRDVAFALLSLAATLRALDRFAEARAATERSLAIIERALGPEHPDVATPLNDLGLVLSAMGDSKGAYKAYERALSIRERAFGPEHPSVAVSLHNLAGETEDPEKALSLYQRALAIARQVYGPDHPEVAYSLSSIGSVYNTLFKFDQAEQAHRQALAIREKTLPPDHPEIASSLNRLSDHLERMGKIDQAIELNERALRIREKAFGPDHTEVAMSLHRLASLIRAVGRLDEARQMLERALAILEKVRGPKHEEVAAALNTLGSIAAEMGELDASMSYYRRAVAIYEETFAPDSPEVALARIELGDQALGQGKLDEAQALFDSSLVSLRKYHGENHPDVAFALSHLATVYRRRGELDQALLTDEQALAVAEATLGKDHYLVGIILSGLGETLYLQGEYEQSAAVHQREYNVIRHNEGPSSQALAFPLVRGTRSLIRLGQLRTAKEYLDEALSRRRNVFGNRHIGIAVAEIVLAELSLTQGRFKEAIRLVEGALPQAAKYPGVLADGKYVLARALWANRRRERARAMAKQALEIYARLKDEPRRAALQRWLSEHPAR